MDECKPLVHGFKLPFYPGDTLLLSFARDPRVEAGGLLRGPVRGVIEGGY